MSDSPTATEIAAAEAYENLFVEGLFAEWAPRVVDAAGIAPGERVLDVACGTGALTREAVARVGEAGSVAGLDAAAGMLAVAERLTPSVDWRLGVADELPFPDDSFDAVVSQFGLMFFPDRDKALAEMRRVLEPDGRLAVAVWGTLETNPAYDTEVELLDRLAGRAAGDALRAPFALGDPMDVTALFESAGMESPHIWTHTGRGRFPDIRTMVEADLRGWLPLMGVVLPEELIQSILTEAEVVLAPYRLEDGSVDFDSTAHVVSFPPRPETSGGA